MVLGGVRNLVEDLHHRRRAVRQHHAQHPSGQLPDRRGEARDVYITEKVDRKTGWQFVCIEEEWTRGYLQEIQDFMECAANGREPRAGLDLACETINVHYAAYWSAEEGRRVRL